MQSIQDEVYQSLKNDTTAIYDTVKRLHDTEADITSGKYSEQHVRDYLNPKCDELRDKVKAAEGAALDNAQRLVDQYKEQRRAALQLDPESLTPDFQLLTSGIPLAERDLCAILDRSEGNLTMLQLAHRYAKQHEISLPQRYAFTGEHDAKRAEIAADGALDAAKRYTARYMRTLDGQSMLDRFFGVIG